MAEVVNTADGGTSGTAATVANTGGGSGTAFNLVSTGIAFLSSTHIDGAMTYQVSPTSGSINVMRRTGLSTKLLSIAGSTYMTLSPTSDTGVVWIGVGSTRVASIHIQGTGRFRISDASGTTGKFTASAAMPINTAVRWELAIEVGTTTSTGRIQFKSFLGSSTTPVDTYDSGYTLNLGTANLTQIDFGKWSAGTYATAYEIDSLRYDDTQAVLLGPYGVTSNYSGTVTLAAVGTLTVTAAGNAAGTVALTGAGTLTVTGVATGQRGTIAVIGDSLTYQDGNGQTNLTAALVARGWWASDINFYAVAGKHYATADTNGKTTVQNVADVLAVMNPALWLIALGTNDRTDTYANNVTKINAIITAIGGGLIRWVNTTHSTGPDADITRGNLAISDRMTANAPDAALDWNAFIHNGRDETGLWQSDTIHMNPSGYVIRNNYVADSALAALSTPGNVAFTGSGALTVTGTPAVAGAVPFGGVGALAASGTPKISGTVSFTASGSITAAGTPSITAPSGFPGSGTLAVTGIASGSATGAVPFSGTGVMTVTGTPKFTGAITFPATGTLAVSGAASGVVTGTVNLPGTGVMTVNGSPRFTAAINLGGEGTLAAVGSMRIAALVPLSAIGALTVTPTRSERDITVTIGSPQRNPFTAGSPTRNPLRIRSPWR